MDAPKRIAVRRRKSTYCEVSIIQSRVQEEAFVNGCPSFRAASASAASCVSSIDGCPVCPSFRAASASAAVSFGATAAVAEVSIIQSRASAPAWLQRVHHSEPRRPPRPPRING